MWGGAIKIGDFGDFKYQHWLTEITYPTFKAAFVFVHEVCSHGATRSMSNKRTLIRTLICHSSKISFISIELDISKWK